MIESFVGISIALSASIALFVTIAVSNKALKESGLHSLTKSEKNTIRRAGYSENELKALEIFVKKIQLD